VSGSFTARHLWLSVLEKPARSRFSRVQRVACGAALIAAYLAASAAWYGVMRTPSDYEQVSAPTTRQ
jgi:polycystin 1